MVLKLRMRARKVFLHVPTIFGRLNPTTSDEVMVVSVVALFLCLADENSVDFLMMLCLCHCRTFLSGLLFSNALVDPLALYLERLPVNFQL